jgi:hypothetical protein
MAYFAAFLLLVSTAFAQPPRTLPDKPTTRKIEYIAMKVSNYGVESPVDFACSRYTAPDAQDTPNPLLTQDTKIDVDVVIGWDGKIYSPFVLGGDEKNSSYVLKTLSSWRFRPALCGGTPINTEATIRFRR